MKYYHKYLSNPPAHTMHPWWGLTHLFMIPGSLTESEELSVTRQPREVGRFSLVQVWLCDNKQTWGAALCRGRSCNTNTHWKYSTWNVYNIRLWSIKCLKSNQIVKSRFPIEWMIKHGTRILNCVDWSVLLCKMISPTSWCNWYDFSHTPTPALLPAQLLLWFSSLWLAGLIAVV